MKRTSYVIARNARGRPTLQHIMRSRYMTICGMDMTYWSKVWSMMPHKTLLCKRCIKGDSR